MNQTPKEIEIDWLEFWTLRRPNATAFKDADSKLSYSYESLFRLSCGLAEHLKEKFSIQVGDRVAVLAQNHLHFIPLFFALQRLGATLVPLGFRLAAPEINSILKNCAPSLFIVQTEYDSILKTAPPIRHWPFDGPDSLASFLKTPASLARSPFLGELDDVCMILYTSGTTGVPKGVMLTNRILFWNALITSLRLGLSSSDIAVGFLPFFHTGGWNVLLTPFVYQGAQTVLLKKFDAERVLELCEKEHVTVLFGLPTTLGMMARAKTFERVDFSSLRFAVVGGEAMPPQLIETWHHRGVAIRQGYGLTEFGPSVFSLDAEDATRKIGSIGKPNLYVQTRVVDENGADVGTQHIGELLLKGPVCTPGYWKQEEATREAFMEGWFKTGDLVCFDNEGFFFVVGRKMDKYISGGENIYPAEIEQVLMSHPAIHEAAVIGVPNETWGEVGVAFVVALPGLELSTLQVQDFCRARLANYKVPKQVHFLAALPKGESGKVLKQRLKMKQFDV
jgi:fatty-acyl-CoA synthase